MPVSTYLAILATVLGLGALSAVLLAAAPAALALLLPITIAGALGFHIARRRS